MAFYDNYIRLCAAKGKSPSAVALEIGLKKSNVTYWKNNRNNPSDITLQKIAEYFGVSVDDLIIDQKEKSPTPKGAELTDNQKLAIEKILNMPPEELAKKMAALEAVLDM